MKLLISVFLLALSVESIANEKFNEAQIDSIEKQLNAPFNYNVIPTYSKGLLADGNNYINVRFETKEDLESNEKLREDTTQYISRCVVFRVDEGGSLRLLSKSAPIVNAGHKSNIFCAIKNKSVLVSVDGWSGGGHSSTIFKFSLKNKKLVLAGVDEYYAYHHSKTDHWIESISSYNLLSNSGIHSIKKGTHYRDYENDFPILPFKVIKPYQYKELKFNTKQYSKNTFSDFDNEKFYDWKFQQQSACSNFDENLKIWTCKP